MNCSPLTPTRLARGQDHTPVSPHFDDVYFCVQDGEKESHEIYLKRSGFIENLNEPKTLTVGEIGFGLGFNFTLTLEQFLRNAHPEAKLHYISVESHPIVESDLIDFYREHPTMLTPAELWLKRYPIFVPGFHTLAVHPRVRLTLGYGDATSLLTGVGSPLNIDHWYFDGFSPSKNPSAFSAELCKSLAYHSHSTTQGSSFTSAGFVRRNLSAAGFHVEKQPGFGKKRESIIFSSTPHFHQKPQEASHKKKFIVVGAGLAGSAIAREFYDRGHEVQVYDSEGIAQQASKNPWGLFNFHLGKSATPLSRIANLGLAHLLRETQDLNVHIDTGLTRFDETDPELFRAVGLQPEYFISNYNNTQGNTPIRIPYAGRLRPQELCRARLQPLKVIPKKFSLADLSTQNPADAVIWATGIEDFPLESLPIRPVKGQIIGIPRSFGKSCIADRYVAPAYVNSGYAIPDDDTTWIGATYQAKFPFEDHTLADDDHLLQDAKEKWEIRDLPDHFKVSTHQRFIGFRASTPDKLPLVGPVPVKSIYDQRVLPMARGTDLRQKPDIAFHDSHYVFTGLGSRGITFSRYLATVLADLVLRNPPAISDDLLSQVLPERFFWRDLKRRPRQKST